MTGPARIPHRPPRPSGKAAPKEPPRRGSAPAAQPWTPPEDTVFLARRPTSVKAMLEAGNRSLPDPRTVDLAAFRNDRALGRKAVRTLRRQVAELHRGGRSAQAFRDFLQTPEGRSTRRQMVAEVRSLVSARMLQGHGIAVPPDLPEPDLAAVRRYVGTLDSAYDIVDAAVHLNTALAAGERSAENLLRGAEQALYRERGVPEAEFATHAKLPTAELRLLRRFADTWAPSVSGRALRDAVRGPDLGAMQERLATRLLRENGYVLPALDRPTLLSLLRDLDSEAPRTARRTVEAVNAALAAGERDYGRLTVAANRAILADLGVPAPTDDPERVRLLRDVMAALPAPERARAVESLGARADFEEPLAEFLQDALAETAGSALGRRLARRGLQSAANTIAALKSLPREVLDGLEGTPAQQERQAVGRVEALLRERFGAALHREPGHLPGDPERSPFVKDWPLQAAAEAYAALERMALPAPGPLTFVYMEGTPKTPPLGLFPSTRGLVQPHPRPGEASQAAGRSGYLGETFTDDQGRDVVVYFDDSLHQPNSDGTPGISGGEGTMIHEIAHAVQLGGTVGAPEEERRLEDRRRVAEWSSLSRWREADGALADGYEGDQGYYYDPAVRVERRSEVATSYGASDPIEDFAEFSPLFYCDPAGAMALSPEKFLFFNQAVGGHHDPWRVAAEADVDPSRLKAAAERVQRSLAASWDEAQPRPGRAEPAV